MKFFRNVLSTFMTEVLIVALNFFAGVLIARQLPPGERGVLALVMLLPITLAYFAEFGISRANVYLLGRRQRPPQAIASNSIVLALTLGGSSAFILWLVRDWVLHTFLSGVSELYFQSILFLIPLLLVDAYFMSILRGQQRFILFNLRRLLTPLLFLGGVIVLVGIRGWGVKGAIIAYAFSTLLTVIVSTLMVGYLIPLRLGFDWRLATEAIGFGLKSYLQSLVGHLNYRLDVYLLALFLPPAEVAYYAIATSIAEVVWYIPNSVGTVLFPKLATEREDWVHSITAEVCRHTVLATGLASLGILVTGWWLIPLFYGTAYRPAVMPLLILTPGILAMAVYKVLTRNFSSRHRQQVSILAASVALVLNVSLNVYLIPRFGVVGAAISSLLSYMASATVLVIIFQRETGIPLRQLFIIRRSDMVRYVRAWFHFDWWLARRLQQRRGDGDGGKTELAERKGGVPG